MHRRPSVRTAIGIGVLSANAWVVAAHGFPALLAGAAQPAVACLLILAVTTGVPVVTFGARVVSMISSSRRLSLAVRCVQHDDDRLDHLSALVGIKRVVRVQQARPSAMTVGLIRPTVVVTSAMLELVSDQELLAVLAHEAHHAQRRHPLVYGIARASTAAFARSDHAASWVERTIDRCETAADHAAAKRVGATRLTAAVRRLHAH